MEPNFICNQANAGSQSCPKVLNCGYSAKASASTGENGPQVQSTGLAEKNGVSRKHEKKPSGIK